MAFNLARHHPNKLRIAMGLLELLTAFISKHASFFYNYGNLVLIPLAAFIWVAHIIIRKKGTYKRPVALALQTTLFIVNLFLGTILYMINFPMKSVVQSLAKVQRHIGGSLDEFHFKTLPAEELHSLADYKGKILILNFWATYCAPCVKELPELKRLEQEFEEHIQVIALSDEDPQKIKTMIKKIDTPSLIAQYTNEKWMNIGSFRPVTIVVDRDGIVRQYEWGSNDYEDFKKMIEKYL